MAKIAILHERASETVSEDPAVRNHLSQLAHLKAAVKNEIHNFTSGKIHHDGIVHGCRFVYRAGPIF